MTDFSVLLDAPGDPAKQVQIAKLGDFQDKRYGEFSITPENVASWQTNLAQLPGGEALIDFEHRSERAPRDSKAAGWITGINLDGDAVMADVKWTPLGEQAIKDRVYRFMSPTYGRHKIDSGAVFDDTLVSAALTNKPFLGQMRAVSLASDENVTDALELDDASRFYQHALDGDLGDETRAQVMLDISAKDRKQAAADGNALGDGSYPIRNAAELHSAAVLAASGHGDAAGARKLIRKRAGELGVSLAHLPGFRASGSDSPRSMDAELIKALGLDEDADDAKVLETVTALKAKADEPAPEPTEPESKTLEQQAAESGKMLLDADRVQQLVADASAGREAANQLREDRRNNVWTKALDQMVRVPAQHESFLKMYELDADGTAAAIEDDIKSGRRLLNAKPLGAETSEDSEQTFHEKIEAKAKELNIGYADAYLKVLDDGEGSAA